ncbi:hypothetical protein C2G38_1314143 [Gigaspora rosea]|uniref:RanBP2-type domain-containing protein n=1 Tax=Gigaspora rosea TaxID=44941 RepID=A0A397W979_9GLOM|nr:hypothetical protein C2G38_1314143 [Gigaspora rosea]
MSQFVKMQQLLQQLEISFDENNFRALFSHIVRNHENFDEKEWKHLLQFDKNWETLGFRNAKKIYSSNKVYQGTKLSTNDFAQKYKKKQAKPCLQYKNDEVNNNSDSISEWKCHNCGFDPNRLWRVKCYKCRAIRTDLDLESFDPYKIMTISKYERTNLTSELLSAKGDKAEEEVKRLGYKFLGWQIGVQCNHKVRDNLYSITGSRNLVRCDTCRYYYYYNCS